MLKKLRIALLATLSLVVLALGLFLIIGGGFGAAPSLPVALRYLNRPVLISHRGVTGLSGNTGNAIIPENTIESFTVAEARGYRWIELDIQYSADERFVVFHDQYGGEALPFVGTVSQLSVSELQSHKLVVDGAKTEFIVPTLDGVAAHFDKRLMYYFDMKKHGHSSVVTLADDIATFIERHGLQDNVFVASHRVAFIAYLEFAHPEVNTVLEGFNEQMASSLEWIPQKFKPDMIAGYQSALDDSLVALLRESDWMQRYITFHVDSTNLRQTLDWGVQFIMVDDGAYVDSLLSLQSSVVAAQ